MASISLFRNLRWRRIGPSDEVPNPAIWFWTPLQTSLHGFHSLSNELYLNCTSLPWRYPGYRVQWAVSGVQGQPFWKCEILSWDRGDGKGINTCWAAVLLNWSLFYSFIIVLYSTISFIPSLGSGGSFLYFLKRFDIEINPLSATPRIPRVELVSFQVYSADWCNSGYCINKHPSNWTSSARE